MYEKLSFYLTVNTQCHYKDAPLDTLFREIIAACLDNATRRTNNTGQISVFLIVKVVSVVTIVLEKVSNNRIVYFCA